MNRITQLIITLSVSFCAMSCIEKVGTELPDTSDYITVTSDVDMQTKAGYEGTSVLPSSFYMTIKQGSQDAKNYTMNRAGSSSNNYNFSGTAPTWTTSDVSQVSIKAVTTPSIQIDNTTYGYTRNSGSMRVCIDQTTAERVEASDLLGAKTGNGITISGNNINVAFNHLMSKLQVSYKSSLTVSKIELANVAVNGTYNYSSMKHVYSSLSTGTINMFRSNNSAEAIFFPFDPAESKVTPELRVYLNGSSEPQLVCPIYLKDGARFIPGKLYMMNISISGTTVDNADVTIENWGANANIQLPGERILWVGTSIPAASGYPEMVAEALNCTVVNNAVGGSRLLGVPDDYMYANGEPIYVPFDWLKIDFNKYPEHGWNHLQAGGLSQTKQEALDKYESILLERSGNNTTWVNKEIEAIQALSYESLIIPYIDGTKDNCTTVIIDHGFNDLSGPTGLDGLHWEAGGHTDPTDHVYGSNYLLKLKNKEVSYDEYVTFVNNHPYLFPESSYIISMKKIIDAIRMTNPNVRIIIGNYFTMDSPYVNTFMYPGQKYTGIICYFNEAVAGRFDLDIVNVHKYLWIDENDFWAGYEVLYDQNNNPYNSVIYDPTKFCPDGVHPTNPDAARAIADVYINALDGVIGSRVN